MIPTVPEFYRGRTLLITGGSGSMGKVLIEKLLRSCPDLDTLYLLLRPKRGKVASERVGDITDYALFDRLKQANPAALDKLVAVSGDVKELGLGLSEEDRRLLQESVSVVFHSAASVRFDDSVRDVVLINVRGTREVVELALGMKKLEAFLHLSTTYSNFDKPEVLEQIYPAPYDWRTMIKMAERPADDHIWRMLTPKIIGNLPNTYTFAKALGEHVINDHRHELPVVIVRPSIVAGTFEEPVPGWVDTFNGPFSLCFASGKGIIASIYGDFDIKNDCVPMDHAIKAMIYIAYYCALQRLGDDLPVYNCCSMIRPMSWREFMYVGIETLPKNALESTLWYPATTITSSRIKHVTKSILFHVIPAIIIDWILILKGLKPMMLKLQRRIFIGNMSVAIFMFTKIRFSNVKFLKIADEMMAVDRKDFAYDHVVDDLHSYISKCTAGGRKYLLKEDPSTIPACRVRLTRMYWLHQTTKTLFFVFLFWMIVNNSKIQSGYATVYSWIDTELFGVSDFNKMS